MSSDFVNDAVALPPPANLQDIISSHLQQRPPTSQFHSGCLISVPLPPESAKDIIIPLPTNSTEEYVALPPAEEVIHQPTAAFRNDILVIVVAFLPPESVEHLVVFF
ncbi:hypothetical protein Q7C36_015312 [Tachysurus vachellii]|uniref:Uncharacterized protein n=1 Tax=Tachysurus vachellii TaxID=175792 RepID=A0AA88MBV5_TACVA|nr:hypothetical protein Q7C36_015312 [Tachysurus vachellii]